MNANGNAPKSGERLVLKPYECSTPVWVTPEMEAPLTPLVSLFHLPVEVQDLILDELSVNDLVACSKVSKSWRMGINCSRVWKKWCNLESYKIENIELYPQFCPESADSEMDLWRKLYGWHEKLRSNWRNRSYRKFKFSEGDSGKVYCFDALPGLVAAGHEDSSIYVWSTKATPLLIAKLKGVLPHLPVLSIKLELTILIAVQRKLLHVFHFQNGTYELTDLKSFELGQDTIDQMEDYSTLLTKFPSRYEECVRASDKAVVASGPLIYNIFENSLFTHSHQSGLVRIWSVPKGETNAVKDIRLEVTQISVDAKSVYITGRDQLTYLMKYDSDTSSFIALLSVPGLKRFLFGDELVVALPSPGDVSLKRIWVYRKGNYSKPIGTRTISGYSNVSLLSPHYVVYTEDASATVWNPFQNAIVRFTTEAVISFVKPTFSCFLLIFMNTSLYLWDWKSGRCLYQLYNGLEWTGHYANLLWADAFTVITGGVDYQLEMISYL